MNLPNKLTVLRMVMVPFFMVCATFANKTLLWYWYFAAGVLFAAASFTDFLDGQIARKTNCITDFGKFADPLADKMLTTAAFIYMVVAGVCDPIVLCLIMAREFAVAGIRMLAAGAKDGQVIAANALGKVKTVLQMVTILIFYFGKVLPFLAPWVDSLVIVLCWLVAAVTLISGMVYIRDNKRYIQ